MNMGVENGDINSVHCYMNISNGYESKTNNYIDYTKKRY